MFFIAWYLLKNLSRLLVSIQREGVWNYWRYCNITNGGGGGVKIKKFLLTQYLDFLENQIYYYLFCKESVTKEGGVAWRKFINAL